MAAQSLSIRQRKFIQGVLKGRSYARAAREAGYSDSVANCAGRKIASKPAVRRKLEEAGRQLEKAGIGSTVPAGPHLTEEQRQLLQNFDAIPDSHGRNCLRKALSHFGEGNMPTAAVWLQWALEYFNRTLRMNPE